MLQHVSDPANLGLHTCGYHHPPTAAIGDHSTRERHVLPVAQWYVRSSESFRSLVNRDALTCKRRLLYFQINCLCQPYISGDYSPGLEDNYVTGNKLPGACLGYGAVAQHLGKGSRQFLQSLKRGLSPFLLYCTDEGIDNKNAHDNVRIEEAFAFHNSHHS